MISEDKKLSQARELLRSTLADRGSVLQDAVDRKKTAIAKRRNDLVEAISLQSQVDWRTAESIISQVEHLDNVLSSDVDINSIAVVVTRQALERHYGGPPLFLVDEAHPIINDTSNAPS